MTRRLVIRTTAAVLLAALVVTAWAFLGPAQLGGRARYVVVEGNSMWPMLSGGDIAVVRAAGDYAPGDVVLYRDADLSVDVLHRIVRVDHGRLVLKGDNNGFYDDARLTRSDVEGALWFSVPRVGSAVMWTQVPLHASLLVFALTVLALGGVIERTPRRRVHAGTR